MIYSRKNVIKSGENRIAFMKSGAKTAGLILICASIAVVLVSITLLIYYLAIKSYVSIIVVGFFVVISLIFFIPGTIMLTRSGKSVHDTLLEGCYVEERYYRNQLNKKNRKYANDAINIARRENRIVAYISLTSTFNAHELYELLKKNETVEYNVRPKMKNKYAKPNNKKSSSYSNHNFDNYFDDEEFDDLMD